MQTAAYAIFIGDSELAARILEQRTKKRITAQIKADGSLPQELARTRSFHYTLYVLNAFIRTARIGEKVGVDIWNYQAEEGKGIYNALAFVVPYINGTKKWPYTQIKEEDEKAFVPLLAYAAKIYDNVEFQSAAQRLLEQDNTHYVNLITEREFKKD
ncbi:MAG: alginate lyase family protein [Spirochaetales bacterium]|nr:alginate lyase family protein [Spirochaetales bacterium]